MSMAGIVLNLIRVALISVFFYFVSAPLLGIELGSVPSWAAP